MSSKKLDKSKWKEGHRRSPRISALEAWKAQPPRRVGVTAGTSTGTGSTASASATRSSSSEQQMKRHLGNVQGPAFRTRARKKRKLRPVDEVAVTVLSPPPNQGQEETSHEDHQTNSDQQVVQGKDGPEPGAHATYTDQPSTVLSTIRLPEKRILELVLDILQRRDTNEIFAEPVDPNEVEDYYEIIEEPMDFGTMRAKLHEGMYKTLEQFEHDAFLITENAMHFNSSATIYFRQARVIHELTKKVFHVLKTYPENFELEFSETRQRSSRRAQGEVGKSTSSSCPKIARNMKSLSMKIAESSKAMACSFSGSSNIRRSQVKTGCSGIDERDHKVLGIEDGRRSRSFEADQRCTYRPWTSFLNENESIALTISSNVKQLEHVNQQDIGYRESLMLFVKDLGPTAQMIARKKLLGWFQLQKSQTPFTTASTQWAPSTLNTVFTAPPSQNFWDKIHVHPTFIMKSTGDSLHSWDADKGEKGSLGDEMGIQSATVEVASSSERKNSHGTLGGEVHSSEFHQNRRNESRLDSFKSNAGDYSFSVSGFKTTGNKSTEMILNQGNLGNEAQPMESPSEYSHSKLLQHRLRNMGIPSFSQIKSSTHKLSPVHLRGDDQTTKAAQGPSHAISSSSETSQVPKPDQAMSLPRQFTFDLPYLRAQLGKINSSGHDRFMQNGSGAELMAFSDKKSTYQRALYLCPPHAAEKSALW